MEMKEFQNIKRYFVGTRRSINPCFRPKIYTCTFSRFWVTSFSKRHFKIFIQNISLLVDHVGLMDFNMHTMEEGFAQVEVVHLKYNIKYCWQVFNLGQTGFTPEIYLTGKTSSRVITNIVFHLCYL